MSKGGRQRTYDTTNLKRNLNPNQCTHLADITNPPPSNLPPVCACDPSAPPSASLYTANELTAIFRASFRLRKHKIDTEGQRIGRHIMRRQIYYSNKLLLAIFIQSDQAKSRDGPKHRGRFPPPTRNTQPRGRARRKNYILA